MTEDEVPHIKDIVGVCPKHGEIRAMDAMDSRLDPDDKVLRHCTKCYVEWFRDQFPFLEGGQELRSDQGMF